MTAPAATVRQTPTGIPLQDGYSTKITFKSAPAVNFWEKSVKPPSVDGGDKIDNTTMFNTAWRTGHPRALKSLMEGTATVAYDPSVLPDIGGLVNTNTEITVTFADGSTLAFWGYLQKFEPNEHKEGEQPEASVTFVPTNYDTDNHVEAGPVVTSVAGT